MVDVRGDVLRPPHGTTPAAVKSNKTACVGPSEGFIYITGSGQYLIAFQCLVTE